MKFETDKSMVVFNGKPGSFSTIEKGKYIVKEVPPFDTADTELTWYKIRGTKFIFAFNLKKLPQGITLSNTFHKTKTLLLK